MDIECFSVLHTGTEDASSNSLKIIPFYTFEAVPNSVQ